MRSTAPTATSLRCRLHLHRYERRYSDDASGDSHYYLECARCGHFRDIVARFGAG